MDAIQSDEEEKRGMSEKKNKLLRKIAFAMVGPTWQHGRDIHIARRNATYKALKKSYRNTPWNRRDEYSVE